MTRPAATTPPALAGSPVAGQTLTASVGAWTGAPTAFAYQWRRCTAQCAAIVGAAAATYTLTPDDIGASISLVVTATGRGGSTSAATAATPPVAAAPVPPATPGSAIAQGGAAGAVSSTDGSATLTWQPGAVVVGSTVSLAPTGKGLAFMVSPALAQLPWPVDLAYAAAPSGVLGYSLDGVVWHRVPSLTAAALPVAQLTGAFTDAAGVVHVLLRTPARVAVFAPGSWGDPTLVAAGPPTPRRVGALSVKRLRNGLVQVTARISVRSQARVLVNVPRKVPAKRSQLMKPGSFPVRVRLHLPARAVAQLRVVAVDPYGRRGELLTRFRGP